MNELIEKLLDEAELDIVWDQDNPDYKWVEGSEESLLKFAELLVRECAEVADNSDATREKWQSIGKFVKEHFGVKS